MPKILIGLIFLLWHGFVAATTLNYTSQYRSAYAEVESSYDVPGCRLGDPLVYTSVSGGQICTDGADSMAIGSFDASGSAAGPWQGYDYYGGIEYAGHVRASQNSSLADNALHFSGNVWGQGVEGSPLHDSATALLDVSFDLATTSWFELSTDLAETSPCVSVEGNEYCSSPGDGYDALLVLEDLSNGSSIFSVTTAAQIDALNGARLALDAGSYRLRIELQAENIGCYSGSYDTGGRCWWAGVWMEDYFRSDGPSSAIYETDLNFAMATVVPIPPTLVLFPSALAALGWARRRQQR